MEKERGGCRNEEKEVKAERAEQHRHTFVLTLIAEGRRGGHTISPPPPAV